LKIINVKSFVALLLVLQIVLSPFSAQHHTKAEGNPITENITHEFATNTWAYNNIVNSPNGNLYFSHVINRNEIVIKNWELGNWKEISSVTSSGTGDTGFNGESDIVVDGQENVHFAFLFEKGTWLDSLRGIKYGVFKNGSWTYETVEANTDPWGGKNIFTPSMALDSNGKAHIVYRYNSSSPRLDEIKYATNQSGSWTIRTIASGTNSKDEVSKPQIEVDPNNEIHITYVKEDNQNSGYNNYYYLHKNTNQLNFSTAEKIVDAISEQSSYTYTPFVVDASGEISFSFYKGNKWSMDIGNETFTTYFQTYKPSELQRKTLITDTDKITYPVQIRKSGSKSVLLMYTQSKDSPPTGIEFFTMVKEGSSWTKGSKEVVPSLINSNPGEINYNIDINGNLMVALLDNGLRKISYLHPKDNDFGIFIESRNARLSNLTINEGALEQGFNPLKTTYTSTVGYGVKTINVTPTVTDANATVTVNGTALANGSPAAVPLNRGSNTITVMVTAEDGTTVKAYTLTVTREAPSTNASLSDLIVSTGSLDQSFDPAITQYKVIVANGTDTIGLTPTLADEKATVTVNGTSVPSGQELTSISLEPGNNSIPIVVTAEDGTTIKTYTVDVQRNNTPVATNMTFTVDEGALSGTTVGTLPASDINGDPLTYSILSGNTDNVFEVNARTGEIKVANSSLLDFETEQSYTLVIQVADGLDFTIANVTINVNDLNDNLPLPKGYSTTIEENLATGTSVGKVTTTDEDAGSNFTYVITSGNSEGAFAIDDNGEITVANSVKLDYELVNSFILTVQVSDGTHTAVTTATINLTNLNDNTPVVVDAQFSVDENATIGTVVGTVSGSDADGDPLNFGIISGNESGAFTINPITGEIIVIDSNTLDYETQTSYVLKVEASDAMVPNVLLTSFGKINALYELSATSTNIATVTINVNNLNDNSPVLEGFTKNIDENTANGTSVGTVYAVDADKHTSFTYRITEGNNEGAFAIDSSIGELTVADATKLDYETIKNFVLTVEVSDGTNTATTTVSINLTNLNEHTPILEDKRFTVDENASIGTVIGTISGIDADGDPLHYGIISGNESDAFGINSVTGEIIVTDGTKLDYETQTTYVLTVKASDAHVQNILLSPFAVLTGMFAFNVAATNLATITINVNNLNDNSPVPQGFTQNIDENTANGTSVGTVTAVDADGDTNFTYSIIAGNSTGAFVLDSSSGELKVANTSKLDYETVKNFTLTVQVSDGTHTAETTVTINLNNINDHTPVIEDAVFSVDENTANGTTVGSIEVNDDDGDSLVFSIVSGNESGAFAIDSTTGEMAVADATKLDFETVQLFTLTIQVTDGLTPTNTNVTINVNNLNDNTPVAESALIAVEENTSNGTVIGTVSGTDADSDPLSYEIVSGNEQGAFAIDSSTGKLTVADTTKLDYETIKSFILTVKVSDGENTAETTVTVNINNLNDNTPVRKDAEFVVDENAGNGTTVGTVEASDADGDALGYTIVSGNELAAFTIDATTGEITVADTSKLDYETMKTSEFTVQVSDGTNAAELVVIVNLTNLNDNSPVGKDSVFTVDENTGNGTVVGTVEASDADGDSLGYNIISGNESAAFTINANSGEIIVGDGSQLDYETMKNYALNIQVSDGTHSADVAVTINLSNLNDNSPVVKAGEISVDENSGNGSVVGKIDASDADGDTLSFQMIDGNEEGAFALNPAIGEITVADASQLDYETIQSFKLTVQVTDGSHIEVTQVSIDLNNLNDNTPVADDVESTIDEEATNGTEIGTVEASDADGDEVRFSIASGNDEGIFIINETTGKITLANAQLLDAATKAMHTLTILVSDGQNPATVNVSVTILSSEATLSSLTSSNGELTPEFKPGTINYTMYVDESIDGIKLTPTVADSNAIVKINGNVTTSGKESDSLHLVKGKNVITLEVTAQNGQKVTYTITVIRKQMVVTTIPVKVGQTVTVSDEEVNLLDDNGTLIIELKKGLDEVKMINFTARQLDALIKCQAMIKIVKEDVQLLIPAANFAKGKDLSITLDRMDKNSNLLPLLKLAASSVYDFKIKQDNKVIDQFEYAIEIGYPTSSEDLKIYYWNMDKMEWQVVGGTFDGGLVKASTHHFSTFAAFNPKNLVDKKPSSELPVTATNLYNGLFAGILVLIVGIGMVLVQRLRRPMN
jgi:hypothetical protein